MPTPVSALIHAATMVTAGVYLLMRTSPLIEYSSTVLILCLWLGAITTVFSSLIGLFQQDIKKVIAYSTMSQLARECINFINMFRHQTICEKVNYNNTSNIYNNKYNINKLNIKNKNSKQLTLLTSTTVINFEDSLFTGQRMFSTTSTLNTRKPFFQSKSPLNPNNNATSTENTTDKNTSKVKSLHERLNDAEEEVEALLEEQENLQNDGEELSSQEGWSLWKESRKVDFYHKIFSKVSQKSIESENPRTINKVMSYAASQDKDLSFFLLLVSLISIAIPLFCIISILILLYSKYKQYKNNKPKNNNNNKHYKGLKRSVKAKEVNKIHKRYLHCSTRHLTRSVTQSSNEENITAPPFNDSVNHISFNEWLGGLIDGDGEFILSKKGHASFKIVMPVEDKPVLYAIKHKYGGSIKNIAGSNSLRYKLHNKKSLIKLINSVNGYIRNPTRLLKLYKICTFYSINLIEPKLLKFNSGWFAGFIDADGSICLNEESGQMSINVTQKNKFLLDPLIPLFNGRVQPIISKEAFQFSVYKKEEILNLIDNYFSLYPLISKKKDKLNLIKKYYYFTDLKDIDKIHKLFLWYKFKNDWDKS